MEWISGYWKKLDLLNFFFKIDFIKKRNSAPGIPEQGVPSE